MPRELSKCREWEKDRRERLKNGFASLSKILPCYEPSLNLSKIDILQRAEEYIEELQTQIQSLLDDKSSKPEYSIVKKLHDRVKKLIIRNEQLCNLLIDAGIKLPSECGNVKKFRGTRIWSNRITPEFAKKLQKKEKENEQKRIKKKIPNKNRKVKNGTCLQRKLSKKSDINGKKAVTTNYLQTSNFITLVTTQSCFIITNAPSTNVNQNCLTKTTTVLTNSNLFSTPLVASAVKPPLVLTKSNAAINAVSSGTLLVANGSLLPVIQPPTLIPAPTILTSPAPIVVKSAPAKNTTLFVVPKSDAKDISGNKQQPAVTTCPKTGANSKTTNVSKTLPPLKPKRIDLSKTAHINKVPIPPLTSKYASDLISQVRTPSNSKTTKNKSNKNAKKESNITNTETNNATDSVTVERTIPDEEISKNETPELSDALTENMNSCKNVDCQEGENIEPIVKKPKLNSDAQNQINDDNKRINIISAYTIDSLCNDLGDDVNEVPEQPKTDKLEANEKSQKETRNSSDVSNEKGQGNLIVTDKQTEIPTTSSSNQIEMATQQYKSRETAIPAHHTQNDSPSKEEHPVDIKTKAKEGQKNVVSEINNPLMHSDLSNDIFASLSHVTAGGQNPESTSPTAAFLLAFPLVSSLNSLKVTEVMEDETADSQHGTPTLLQIGTMDSAKTTQSQSDNLTPSLLNLDNFSFFSREFYPSFDPIVTSASNVCSIPMSTPIKSQENKKDFIDFNIDLPEKKVTISESHTKNDLKYTLKSVTNNDTFSYSNGNKACISTVKIPTCQHAPVVSICQNSSSISDCNNTTITATCQSSNKAIPVCQGSITSPCPNTTVMQVTSCQNSALVSSCISAPIISTCQVPAIVRSACQTSCQNSAIVSSCISAPIIPTCQVPTIVRSVSQSASAMSRCQNNTIIPKTQSNTVVPACQNKTGVPTCLNNTIVPKCLSNTIVSTCLSNTIVPASFSNSMVPTCLSNTIVPTCLSNTIVPTCFGNAVVPTCLSNTIVPMCLSNTIVPISRSNTVIPTCRNSALVSTCQNNTIVTMRDNPTIAQACHSEISVSFAGTNPNTYIGFTSADYNMSYNHSFYTGAQTVTTSSTTTVTSAKHQLEKSKMPEKKACNYYPASSSYSIPQYNTFNPFTDIPKSITTYPNSTKSYNDGLYTNNSTYSYNYHPDNFSSTYPSAKTNMKPEKLYYGLNYDNYDYKHNNFEKYDMRNQQFGNYYSQNQVQNKDKTEAQNKNNVNPNTNVKMPVNWMTTPDVRQQSQNDFIVPPLAKEMDFGPNPIYSTNSFSTPQTTYFNTNASLYTSGDLHNTAPFPAIPPNSFQRSDMEENQFSWSPSKLPQLLDTAHNFVSGTLPTLVGDLALGNTQAFAEQKVDNKTSKDFRLKESIRRSKPANNYDNQSNFLSVSQLVDHNKNDAVPSRVANRRSSGNRSSTKASAGTKSTKRVAKTDKDISSNYNSNNSNKVVEKQMKQHSNNNQANQEYQNQNNNDNNTNWMSASKNRNVKIPSNSYSAEALIGHQSQNEVNRSRNAQNYPMVNKSLPVPFLADNIIPYFPMDIPQENTLAQQNQNYQSTTFGHNFSSGIQGGVYPNSSFVPNAAPITTSYLPSANFMPDIGTNTDYAPILPENSFTHVMNRTSEKYSKTKPAHNEKTNDKRNMTQSNAACPVNSLNPAKKSKKKQPAEPALSNFDFSFLSMPAAINSPILPDDFHAHSNFLPPPTPTQLYPCKNPLYGKQELAANGLLPLAGAPRSGVPHPEVSPSMNNVGTTLTNFNLSTIFPEINKVSDVYPDNLKTKDYNQRDFLGSTSQVPFKSNLSYINSPTSTN